MLPVLLRRSRTILIKLVCLVPLVWLIFLVLQLWRPEPITPIIVLEESQVALPQLQQDLDGNRNQQNISPRQQQINHSRPSPQQQQDNELDSNYNLLGVLPHPDDHVNERPGEYGKPFKPGNLTKAQKVLVADGWKKNAFNQFSSDLISVRRSLPDPRDPWCKEEGRYLDTLSSCSVIICFHNEAWSVLLRTVHSVFDRSPKHLLEEIILVDDYSDMDHLKSNLESYMHSKFSSTVKIIRAEKREGLIRARLLGAASASAPTIIFLDSHIECTVGWLEPLLDRIERNKSTVVCPVIDVIDDDTLEFHYGDSKATSVGGFDWNLQFTWHSIPEKERARRKHPAEPVWSPTMAGGLFAIDRGFFTQLGLYDPGFDIWGGENLELSFKTWMCGGTLEIVPCSHVGHIFRKRSPYRWRSGVNVLRRNSVRLAQVWLDDYAKYYYQRIGGDLGNYGDVSDRKAIREKLQCKSFKWYLDNIYPELFIPGEALAHGEIRNLGHGGRTCLDSPATKKQMNKPVGLYPCHSQGGNQYWSYSKGGEIRRDEMCVDYAGVEVMIYPCHGSMGNQHWIYDDSSGEVRHGPSHKCLTMRSKEKLLMESCDGGEGQRWKFQNYNGSASEGGNLKR